MKLSTDFLAELRRELDDLPTEDQGTVGCLWSDEDLYRYMTEAAGMVARRTYSYRKNITYTVTAGNPMIKLPDSPLLRVYRAYLTTAKRELVQLDMGDQEVRNDYGYRVTTPDYETATGTPGSYMLDYQPGYLRLYPIPTVDDTLVLHGAYTPTSVIQGAPLPLTDPMDIELMRLYVLYRAYSKHDADTFNPTKARDNEVRFEEGARLRNPEFRRHHSRPGIVASSW